jgi:hypothetical protein
VGCEVDKFCFFEREGDFLFFNFSSDSEKILSCKLCIVGSLLQLIAAYNSVFFVGWILIIFYLPDF